MPGKTEKRKKAEDAGDDDEIQSGRRNKFRRIGSSSKSKVRFAPTTQAISFTKDEQPTSILKTQPTSFPTFPGGSPPNHEDPPSTNTNPNPSKQPLFEEEEVEEEKPFTTHQANELSNIATAALQILQTTEEEEKQLKHDLAATRRELELSRNDNRNLCWRKDMYMNASDIANRALEDATKRLKDAEAELKAALGSNDELKDMLRTANEELEKAQCELARSSSKEKVGDEVILNC